MKFKNHTFKGENILLDGNEFKNCIFKQCHIEYYGITPITIDGAEFDGCTWGLCGPADNALVFLTALYAAGGDSKAMIEKTFDHIRQGKPNLPH